MLLMAEVANYCIPRIADLHNYSTANSLQQKRYNWETLAERVFKRVGLKLTAAEIDRVILARPGAAESLILRFKQRAEALKQQSAREAEAEALKQQSAREAEAQRDSTIQELEETNSILTAKAESLQKLLQLRDAKIELLTKALQAAAAPPPQ
ncbi:Zgc:66426, related [Eimeria praecox]|uniref:Zgc:66426, related n=1 Tax=Eimeria praecox TaxID=51316 RepID=U6H3K6_9EIME|nr:Zgc:66426, related [Eimeria praecox]